MKRKVIIALLGLVVGIAIVTGIHMGNAKTTETASVQEELLEETDADALQNVILEDKKDEVNVKEETKTEEKANVDSGSAPVENAYDVAYANQLAEETPEENSEKTEVQKVTVTMYATQNVNVRKEPDADSEKLGGLTKGQEVLVSGITAEDEWAVIQYDNQDGYVNMNYLSETKPAEQTAVTNNNVSGAHASNTTKNNPSPTASVVDSEEADAAADTTGKTEVADVSNDKAKFDAISESIGAETGRYPSGVEATQAQLPSQEETKAYTESLGIDYDSIELH